jgi:hypothetical protein
MDQTEYSHSPCPILILLYCLRTGTEPVPEMSCFLLIPLIFHWFLLDDGHGPEVFNDDVVNLCIEWTGITLAQETQELNIKH